MRQPIPNWNSQGLIGPVNIQNPTSLERSPYVVSLVEVVRRFATSTERVQILQGFLQYRAALHSAGLDQGFQWLNGSFLENKEAILGEAPGDIDVATFYHPVSGTTEAAMAAGEPLIFGPDGQARKRQFHVDAYLVPLSQPPENLVWSSHYWYSVFSHSRRNFLWKGFLQVDLSSVEDATATALLTTFWRGATP